MNRATRQHLTTLRHRRLSRAILRELLLDLVNLRGTSRWRRSDLEFRLAQEMARRGA